MMEPKPCKRCGKEFGPGPKCTRWAWAKKNYCSRSCARTKKGPARDTPYPFPAEDIVRMSWWFVRKMRIADHHADDAAQEGCIAAMNALKHYDPEKGEAKAYIRRSIGNRLKKFLAGESRRRAESIDADEDGGQMPVPDYREDNPLEAAERNDLVRAANAIRSGWPVDKRRAFHRHYVGGL
jgi:RNA polymerase sigma factor (sigma-70 family)